MLQQKRLIHIGSLQTPPIPLEEFLDTFLYFHFMSPAEGVEFAHVYQFAHGSIGLGSIKLYRSFKTDGLDYQFGEPADGEFLASADIDMAIANLAQ